MIEFFNSLGKKGFIMKFTFTIKVDSLRVEEIHRKLRSVGLEPNKDYAIKFIEEASDIAPDSFVMPQPAAPVVHDHRLRKKNRNGKTTWAHVFEKMKTQPNEIHLVKSLGHHLASMGYEKASATSAIDVLKKAGVVDHVGRGEVILTCMGRTINDVDRVNYLSRQE